MRNVEKGEQAGAGMTGDVTGPVSWQVTPELVGRRLPNSEDLQRALVLALVVCVVLESEAGGSAEASLLAEIRMVAGGHEFYDFEAKYLDGSTEYDLLAGLPDRVTERIQELAVRTFAALDCAGLARVDFFVTPDLKVYMYEINTVSAAGIAAHGPLLSGTARR